MKHKLTLLIALIISIFTLNSCDVEFDPNGKWQETTIVYGILDQDADTNLNFLFIFPPILKYLLKITLLSNVKLCIISLTYF